VPAPYINSATLLNQPAGLSWNVVPTLTADQSQQTAQLNYVCQQVTSLVDGYLNQPLRAVAVTETNPGPGHPRVAVNRHNGTGTLITRQWPVTSVNEVLLSPARDFPPNWTLVPADQYRIRTPVLTPAGSPVTGPSGGNAIDVAPGYISERHGRGGWLVSLSTTSGYPHTQLTGDAQVATSGAQVLTVEDVTGWDGWTGWILDGPETEPVTVTAVAATTPVTLPGGTALQAGPGTLTLAAPLQNAHGTDVLLTAIPLAALQAAALSAAVMALETLTAIAVQSSSGQLPGGLGSLAFESEAILDPFKRVM